MARTRYLRPEFFEDEEIGELDYSTRLLFQGLWLLADRAGRLPDKAIWIKIKVFPYDDVDIEKGLKTLALPKKSTNFPFIQRYKADNKNYIQILKWNEHQKPHHQEPQSLIPEPPTYTIPSPSSIPLSHPSTIKKSKTKTLTITKTLTTTLTPKPKPLGESLTNTRTLKTELPKSIEMFDQFWTAYPKKKSKGTAEKAFKKINPDQDLLNLMIEKIAEQETSNQWNKSNGDFIPHPATWLNAKGWTDEITDQKFQGIKDWLNESTDIEPF